MDYVIISAAGQFWTGRGFSPEYPDAMIYHNRKSVRDAFHKLLANNEILKDYSFSIYRGWGTEDQTLIEF